MTVNPALDLDAYFNRIGHTGFREPTLATLDEISAHHAMAIPFENLDVLLARPVSLTPEAIQHKLITSQRGGYCFEHNRLFMLVLDALGFHVTPHSARVRWQHPRDFTPPRTHLFLQVRIDDEPWIVDVGIGGFALTRAIRFVEDTPQKTLHDTRRIIHSGDLFYHQILIGNEWADLSEFTMETMPQIDCETANWFTSTHPESRFRQSLIVARAAPNGKRLSILNHEFTIRGSDGAAETRTIESADELLKTLAADFGLHFPPQTRFGPPGSPFPC